MLLSSSPPTNKGCNFYKDKNEVGQRELYAILTRYMGWQYPSKNDFSKTLLDKYLQQCKCSLSWFLGWLDVEVELLLEAWTSTAGYFRAQNSAPNNPLNLHLSPWHWSPYMDPPQDRRLLCQVSCSRACKLKTESHPPFEVIKGLWRSLVPHRIEWFSWLALLGKLHTKTKLAKIGLINYPWWVYVCAMRPTSGMHQPFISPLLLYMEYMGLVVKLMGTKLVYPNVLKSCFRSMDTTTQRPSLRKGMGCKFFCNHLDNLEREKCPMLWRQTQHPRPTARPCPTPSRLVDQWLGDKFPYSPNEVLRNPMCLKWSANSTTGMRKTLSKQAQTWTPPPQELLKWNVDASLNPAISKSSIRGVLRDHSGKFMCLFSSPIPLMEINHAETLAIHWAINITRKSERTKHSSIIIESDSSNAVKWCNGVIKGPWNLTFTINSIRGALAKGPSISIVYRSRESNMVADSMAKQGLTRNDEFLAWL